MNFNYYICVAVNVISVIIFVRVERLVRRYWNVLKNCVSKFNVVANDIEGPVRVQIFADKDY